MSAVATVKALPPWAWVAATAAVGVAFLAWYHHFDQDATDAWNYVEQPPAQADLPMLPDTGPAHGRGRPMAASTGFRSRQGFPGILDVDLGFSVGGG